MVVLFCGINPGLYSGATGHHFARPGNRFWPALHLSGFTPSLFHPSDQKRLLDRRLGITNLVARTTARAEELRSEELQEGIRILESKVGRFRPETVAFLGISTYRTATGQKNAVPGPQPRSFGGSSAWVLPNPSGLNAHYQLPRLTELFVELRKAVGLPDARVT